MESFGFEEEEVGVENLFKQLQEQTKKANHAIETRETNYFEHTINPRIQKNPFFLALYQNFLDVKYQIRASTPYPPQYDLMLEQRKQQLDQMLMNENVIMPTAMTSNNNGGRGIMKSQQQQQQVDEEYTHKLNALRNTYTHIISQTDGIYYEMEPRVNGQLQQQSAVRPIFPDDVQALVSICRHKLEKFKIQVKLETCQAAMALRSKAAENRKKRRNFSKEATTILNDFYFANLDNPYPDDQTKAWLSEQTGLTVGQVSNWFGNKRIRHRQRMIREKEPGNEYCKTTDDKENIRKA